MDSENLIALVYAKPEIWNQSHKLYSSKEKKQRAWQLISETLNVTVSDAKLRWTNMRDLFRRDLKKTINMARMTGDPEAYVPRWKHFRSMLFLRDQMVKDLDDLPDMPSLTFDEDRIQRQPPEEDDECLDMEDEFYEEYFHGSTTNHVNMAVVSSDIGRKREEAQGPFNGYGYDIPQGSSSKKDRFQENKVGMETTAGHGLGSEPDEDYHFVMSILGSVRRIRPDRKTLFKVKVLQLIVEEENALSGP